MSFSIIKLDKLLKSSEPRISFDQADAYIINEAGSQILYQKYPATNFTGDILQFNTVQSPTVAVSSKIFIECEFEVTLSGIPDPGTSLYQISNDAPRFMPLMAVTNTANLQLNGTSMTVNPDLYGDAIFRYLPQKSAARGLSGCPSMFDYYQQYNDFLQFGSALNSLAQIGECSSSIQGRGGFPIRIDASNPQAVKITFVTYEPIWIPPCNIDDHNSKAFIGLNRLNYTCTLKNLSRVWSRNETNSTPVTVSARITNTPNLVITTITPQLIDMVPRVNRYPFSQIQPQSQDYGAIAPGSTRKISFNAQQLQGVPERMFIFARRTNRSPFTTDTYMRLTDLNLQFDNETGIFSAATPNQLYNICAENGYQGSYADWYQYSGSVMSIDFTKDVPLQGLAVGVAKNVTFRFDCNFTNLAADAYEFSVYLVVVYQGVFTISIDGGVFQDINVLSQNDVINSKNVQALPYHDVRNMLVHGGSFFSKLKSIGSTAKKYAKKALDAYENLAPETKSMVGNMAHDAISMVSPGLADFAKDLAPGALKTAEKLLASGYTQNQVYQMLAKQYGGAKKKAVGGKKLTKKDLLKIAQG